MPQDLTGAQAHRTTGTMLAEQTEIRKKLLVRGYAPLANVSKVCVLSDWPRLVVNEDLVETWSDQRRYLATGVRIEGDMLVLDMDIDDADILDAVWRRLPEDLKARLDAAPCRFGKGEKFALFVRLAAGEKRVGRQVSQGYAPPDDPDRLMRAEAFDSAKPRQLGAYGPHSFDDDGGVAVWYEWADGVGLADVDVGDLPEVTRAEVEAVLDAASSAMLDAGWSYEVKTASGVMQESVVYDIEDNAVFETAMHGDLDFDELEDVCGAFEAEGVRLSASWLEGPSAVTRSRCIARLNPADGRLQIWESAAQVIHRPVWMDINTKLQGIGERLSAVSARAADAGGGGGEGEAEAEGGAGPRSRLEVLLEAVPEDARFFGGASADEGGAAASEEEIESAQAEIVEALVDRYAYWSDGSGYVVDVNRGPEAAMSISSFRTKMRPLSWTEIGPRGGVKEVNPAEEWEKHPRRADVAGYRFLPRSRERAVVDGDLVFLNTWERPEWWDAGEGEGEGAAAVSGAGAATFFRFLEHLIPSEDERKWFIGWLAAKVQKPWLPNCGVVMVAERQGTGRGTLFDMIGGVLGRRHVKNVSAVQLIGGGSQSQYTDWLEESLVVTCDEVLAGDDTGGAMAWKRREVYERLKALVDPRPRVVPIVRKGLPNYQTEVYASFLLATNNVNALPLSPDDRRIAVITNTGVPLVEHGDFLEGLNVWRDDAGFTDEFCASVFAALKAVPVNWAAVREAPRWMLGRARMLEANETDLDGVLENILEGLEGDFILGHHLRERVGRSLEANGLIDDVKHWWSKTQDMLGRMNRLGWRRMDGRHKYAPKEMTDNVSVVFYREKGAGPDAWTAASREARVKLWAGGDPTARKAASDLGRRMADKGIKVVDTD